MSSLTEVLRAAVDEGLSGVHTSIPARIESYDHNEQRASVLPLIKQKYRDGTVQSMPIIDRVPVIFPSSEGFSMTFPLKPGDTVLLVFSERSLENWLVKGGEQEPGDPRKFDLTDAIAIPGIKPFSRPGGLTGLFDALTAHTALSEMLPLMEQATAQLTGVRDALNLPIPNLIGAAIGLTAAQVSMNGLRVGFTGIMPILGGNVPHLSGIIPFLHDTENNIGIVNSGLSFLLPDITNGIASVETMIDNLSSVTGVINMVLPHLGGVGSLLGPLGSILNNTDAVIQYKGFRLVMNPDGRYAIGNDLDEVMSIVQMVIGSLCASVCIPGCPLTEIPVFTALFYRLLTLRGNLNSLIPFAAGQLPDLLGKFGPDLFTPESVPVNGEEEIG